MPPAARVTDLHACPMVSGVVPHVGGPILPPGCPTVKIGFMPAARVGDQAACAGGPDVIAKGSATVKIGFMPAARMGDQTAHGGVIALGCFTVMIGDAASGGGGGGGGGASGGGGGGSAGGGAASSQADAVQQAYAQQDAEVVEQVPADQVGPVQPQEQQKRKTWIGILLRDFDGRPVPNETFQVTLRGGQVLSGVTDEKGHARFEDLDPDHGEVDFVSIPEGQKAEIVQEAAGDEGQEAPETVARQRRQAKEPEDVEFIDADISVPRPTEEMTPEELAGTAEIEDDEEGTPAQDPGPEEDDGQV